MAKMIKCTMCLAFVLMLWIVIDLNFLDVSHLKQVKTYLKLSLDYHNQKQSMSNENLTMPPVGDREIYKNRDDYTSSEALHKKVRIICWIMTCPANLDTKAVHVRNTWGRRCNILIFISSVTNPSFPTIGFNTTEGRSHLTEKTMHAFRYIYEHYMDEADWFMKADDDTYVIMENLRHFLSSKNPNESMYFGHYMKRATLPGYLSGGAGYVLSKEALKRYGQRGFDPKVCRQTGPAEDLNFANCMKKLGVMVGKSTDNFGRRRVHCFAPEAHLHGKYPSWYHKYEAFKDNKRGIDSISNYAISFHYVTPSMMYNLEFYIYHLRAYGTRPASDDVNQS